jgi:iron-sulfur cluster repair protein YtfE (RIC family)
MEAMQVTTRMTPCGSSLPELEVPMINTIVTCLSREHRRLDDQILQLALAATRLGGDAGVCSTAKQRAVEIWDGIRCDLWSHLQIEDELVFSWGRTHQAISDTLLDNLKIEHQELHNLLAALPSTSDEDRQPQTAAERGTLGRTLLALAQTLDRHNERYDGEVLPAILRALFNK